MGLDEIWRSMVICSMEKQKIKILVLSNHDTCIYNIRLETMLAFLDKGYEVILSSPNGSKIEALREMGMSYIETSFNNQGTSVKDDLKLIKHYQNVIRQVKPNVVLTYMIKPNIYGGIAATKEKIPFIANITGLGKALEYDGLMQKITTMLYRYAFRKVACVFFQNQHNLDFFKTRNIAVDKARLLPGSGVNLEKFTPMPYPSEAIISFVFIARVMKEKGIDQYIETAKYIKEKYPNTTFNVCGSSNDEYLPILEKYDREGIIKYHGRVDDMREILKDVHCTIHPSYYPEGMSNVLLESAATERALITTNRPGCGEIVDDGVNGYIVEQENSADLIAKVEQFINLTHEEKISMGEKGRIKVENEFDRNIVVQAYLDEVEKVALKK